MSITMLSFGHFYSIWIDPTAYNTAEIKVTKVSQSVGFGVRVKV